MADHFAKTGWNVDFDWQDHLRANDQAPILPATQSEHIVAGLRCQKLFSLAQKGVAHATDLPFID